MNEGDKDVDVNDDEDACNVNVDDESTTVNEEEFVDVSESGSEDDLIWASHEEDEE